MSYREFFDDELIPLVRRMADRARPSDASPLREIRDMVWQGLVGLRDSYGDTVEFAEFLGSVLYQGPLLDTLTATELGAPADSSYALAVGSAPLMVGPSIQGQRSFVRFAAEADHLVVGGDSHGQTVIAVVPRDHPSVSPRRYEEIGRGELYDVTFTDTPVTAWLDATPWPQVLANARIRQAAYLVGLAQGALDLAVGYAKQRKQFGKPIGRFQALAFRLSELTMRVDGARLLTRAATRGGDHRLAAAQCLATAADLARTVTTATMQIHGAVGMTSDCDAQLFYRRAAVESVWLGTPTQLRAEAIALLALQLTQI